MDEFEVVVKKTLAGFGRRVAKMQPGKIFDWEDEKVTIVAAHQLAIDKAVAEKINGDTSDGYHTFNELYDYRKVYNAALFNEWAKLGRYKVHKSWHHADAPHEPIFGGGWFIVMAELPTGQISNHYDGKDWSLFNIPEAKVAHAWDGHTPVQALERLAALSPNNGDNQ